MSRGLGHTGSTRRVVSSSARREPMPAITADELERAFRLAPEAAERGLRELSRILRNAKP